MLYLYNTTHILGKEGFATISYEVVVDHQKRIMHSTAGHYGSRNDLTIVKFDGFVTKMRRKEMYHDITYQLYGERIENGQQVNKTHDIAGAYLICDGGYVYMKL